MLTPHNPLNIIAVPMGVKELIFPVARDLLEGDIFTIEHIIHLHQVGCNLQTLPDPSQVNGRSTLVQQREKTSEPTTQDWQHCEEPTQGAQQQTQGLLCRVRGNCRCK